MNTTVGADIESICNKCGDVWHVVVAKADGKIAKVQCKQCGGYHRYRASSDAKGSQTKSAAVKRSSAASKASGARAKKESSSRAAEPAVQPDLERPVRPYQYKENYQPGDRIEHPKFGQGVVELTHEPGKMQVFFADGRRVLALAKPEGALQRPQPFRHGSDGESPL